MYYLAATLHTLGVQMRDTAIRKAKPGEKPTKLADGGAAAILVARAKILAGAPIAHVAGLGVERRRAFGSCQCCLKRQS